MATEEVKIVIKASDQTGGTLKKTGLQFTELASKISIAQTAIQSILATAKQIYEFGRAGAELEYAATRFDRLSKSIGTTSDVLLRDLREATKGTRSDMELMAGAADLVGLGLANSHDQAVRMSNVVGGLGMDMNQLVLTLTNQTTMRFDALGVAVDGFDDKVKALKKSGMDANAAFTEAFLQQAEEQLERVGNKADESIGSFERFEAGLKNIADQAKRNAAPALAGLADAMADVLEQGMRNAVLDEYTRGMTDIERGAFLAKAALLGMTEEEQRSREAIMANRQAMEESAPVFEETASSVDRYKTAIREANEGMNIASDYANEMAAAGERLSKATDSLKTAQENYRDGVGNDMARVLENAGVKGEKYHEALSIIDDVTGTSLLPAQQLEEAQAKLAEQYAKGKITGEEFKTALEDLTNQFMPFDESVQTSTQLVADLRAELESIQRTFVARVQVVTTGGVPSVNKSAAQSIADAERSAGYDMNGNGVIGAAGGADFIVPPGYPNDSFPMRVQSGEHVKVTPANQVANHYNLTINEAGGRGNILSDFALLKALSGA